MGDEEGEINTKKKQKVKSKANSYKNEVMPTEEIVITRKSMSPSISQKRKNFRKRNSISRSSSPEILPTTSFKKSKPAGKIRVRSRSRSTSSIKIIQEKSKGFEKRKPTRQLRPVSPRQRRSRSITPRGRSRSPPENGRFKSRSLTPRQRSVSPRQRKLKPMIKKGRSRSITPRKQRSRSRSPVKGRWKSRSPSPRPRKGRSITPRQRIRSK